MGGPEQSNWTDVEAVILTMVSTNKGALPLAGLLLRMDSFDPPEGREAFADAMGRLVAARLVVWMDNRFSVTAAGQELSPGGFGRYFKDLFEETRAALDGRVPRPPPADLGITDDDYDQAVTVVGSVKNQRHTRKGLTGHQKWTEWHDAPPLDFGDCLEFLTFAAGEDVVAVIERTDHEPIRVEGKLGALSPDDADEGTQVAVFPVVPLTGDPVHLTLDPAHFETASYNSYDGWDYFFLRMEFDAGTTISLCDNNAPTL